MSAIKHEILAIASAATIIAAISSCSTESVGAYALIGRTDDAIEWTRIAISRGFLHYPFLSSHDPFLEPIRSDARFEALMINLRPRWEAIVEWEHLSVK